jgi:hypothetical protein
VLQSRIAELSGDFDGATIRLTKTLTDNSLSIESRSQVHLALAKLYTRLKKLPDADREFINAIRDDPQNVVPRINYAEHLLYARGDTKSVSAATDEANKITVTTEAKRLASLSEYLGWAREYLGGHASTDIKRILQISFVAPEEAFILGAQFASLSEIVIAMLKAAVIQNLESRDAFGNTALIAASAGNNADIVRLLVANRANVNVPNRDGERALSLAIINGNRDSARLLLNSGAEVNYVDSDNRSPLSVAVTQRDAMMVNELLRRKAKVSTKGMWSAGDLLVMATINDDLETMKSLLDSGIKVDALDQFGKTALISAAYWGRSSVARLLLERGADARLAIGIAKESRNPEMIKMLEDAVKRLI